MQKRNTKISYIAPNSLADRAGLSPGDSILKVNGHEIHDILEYRYLASDTEVVLDVLKKDGSAEIITIESDYEDLGIEFSEALIDEAKSCKNKCIFCFIDQLPKGMRDTVYFKDDDTRLSFLQGNYVTLTNVSEDELSRIVSMHISPINISVHTTNPKLRVEMLKNPNASKIFETMKMLAAHGISMNCQIVLCPGYNDKAELDRTICDLESLYPYVMSCSVVPVGLTKCRDGLYKLKPFDPLSSLETVRQIEKYQKKFRKKYGLNLIYPADEFYINAKLPIPQSSEYDGFPQIENGVGLVASMQEEFDDAIKHIKPQEYLRNVAIATGEIAYGFIKSLSDRLMDLSNGLKITVFPVKNEFFGGGVTVSGLVTASDIIRTIKDASEFDELLITECMLRNGDDVFLDDISLSELSLKLGVKITPTPNDGYLFIENVLNTQLEF